MITTFRALLMLSLMATSGVVRGVPSLLTMSRHSQRVRPFLGEGAFGVVEAGATAGVGFSDGVAFFFFPFLATSAHVEGGEVLHQEAAEEVVVVVVRRAQG